MDVLVFRQANVLFRYRVLQLNDALCASVRVSESRKLEQGGDVGLIFCADVAHTVAIGEAIFPVGHVPAALPPTGGRVLASLEARAHPQAAKPRRAQTGAHSR